MHELSIGSCCTLIWEKDKTLLWRFLCLMNIDGLSRLITLHFSKCTVSGLEKSWSLRNYGL